MNRIDLFTSVHKIGEKKEVFLLRGRDASSPATILKWIERNLETAPDEKLREAFECALKMKNSPLRRAAD